MSGEAFVSPGERQILQARLYSTAGVRATDDGLTAAVHCPRAALVSRTESRTRRQRRGASGFESFTLVNGESASMILDDGVVSGDKPSVSRRNSCSAVGL